jgi:hypothetical protein
MEQTMADKRQKRVAEFIEPFRVKPGSKVRLEEEFDPSFKSCSRRSMPRVRTGRSAT